MNLRLAGPTPLPPQVREALALPMIDHRGPEFASMQERILSNLKRYFQTQNDILIFTASGTGGMEAAIVNTLSPGDPVLVISVGVFGDRLAEIAQAYGAQVTRLDFPRGKAAEPDGVRHALRDHPGVLAVLITHNETSTAVTNPLAELARVVHENSDALLIVDAISSLGAVPLPVDEWGVDVAITGSQKVWMIPPGLTMLSVSPRGWQANARARTPRFYWDFSRTRSSNAKGQTPFTPGINLFQGLDAALQIMNAEGFENIVARHARVGMYTRSRVKGLGWSLLADETHASNTVTAIRNPDGIDGKKWRAVLRQEYDTVIAGGQKELADKIVRVGHLGYVTEKEIDDCVTAMGAALQRLRSD